MEYVLNLLHFGLTTQLDDSLKKGALFALSVITQDKTKYNYLVLKIDYRLSTDVEDLITNPTPLR